MYNVPLVTMFYDIGRDSWKLHPRKVDEYIEAFSVFLNYDYSMIIFIDSRYFDTLKSLVKNSKFPNSKKLISINEKWLNDNIWSWSKLERETEIMSSESYKKLLSQRISMNYPENVNPKYTILTHSKIDFVNYAIDNNFADGDFVGWVDFGYFQNKTSWEYIPNNVVDISKLDQHKVNLCLVHPLDERDKDIQYTLLNAPEKIAAYFFAGDKFSIKQFQKLCHKWLENFQKIGIADDEQSLWLQCYYEMPEIFQLNVFGKWHQALKKFSK